MENPDIDGIKDKKTAEAANMTTLHGELFQEFPETPDRFKVEFPDHWSPYKTASEKLDYTTRLSAEIRPFIRAYFQEHKGEMEQRINSETLREYTENTVSAWEKHMMANEAIDCFLNYELRNRFGDWSPDEWDLAKRLLLAGMETDHVKAMYSGGIKDKLEVERKKLAQRYEGVVPDFENQLMTPSFPTFYEARPCEHKKYKLSVLEGKPDLTKKQEIINRYYAGDEGLFDLRDGELKLSDDPETLRREIDETESRFDKTNNQKFYFMLERPDIQDFEDLLRFDNVTEYEYTYSLKGLPDLFLREEILRRLVEAGALPKDTSVFSLGKENFTEAIDKTVAELNKKFEIRLRQYRQTADTCGTACIMSILNRKGLPLNQEEEMAIWQQVGYPYNFPGGLAKVLLRFGFEVDYVQNSPELLSKNNPEFESNDPELLIAAEDYVRLHIEAVEAGLHFEHKDWNFDTVLDETKRGNVCLVYIYVTEEVSHCVLVHGFKGDRLLIVDPLNSIKTLAKDEFNRRIDTPMGKRMLVTKKLPNDFFTVLGGRLKEIGY